MKSIFCRHMMSIVFGFIGALIAILLMAVLQYPNAVKIESAIGTLGAIIGLILAGIGVFITIYSSMAVEQIDKRVTEEGIRVKTVVLNDVRVQLNSLANGLLMYNRAVMETEAGKGPIHVHKLMRKGLHYYPELPNARTFIVRNFINVCIKRLCKVIWTIPKDDTRIAKYLNRCIGVLDELEQGKGDTYGEIVGTAEYLKALVYGAMGYEVACMASLQAAIKRNKNIISDSSTSNDLSMILYSFTGKTSIDERNLSFFKKCFNLPKSGETYISEVLDRNDEKNDGTKLIALFLPNKDYPNIPPYYPCYVDISFAGNLDSSEKFISFGPWICNSSEDIHVTGKTNEELASIIRQHFLILGSIKHAIPF